MLNNFRITSVFLGFLITVSTPLKIYGASGSVHPQNQNIIIRIADKKRQVFINEDGKVLTKKDSGKVTGYQHDLFLEKLSGLEHTGWDGRYLFYVETSQEKVDGVPNQPLVHGEMGIDRSLEGSQQVPDGPFVVAGLRQRFAHGQQGEEIARVPLQGRGEIVKCLRVPPLRQVTATSEGSGATEEGDRLDAGGSGRN